MNILDYIGLPVANAQTSSIVDGFVGRVNSYIINPLIILMFSVALAFFLYGVVEFIMNADKADEREIGQQHIMWGVIGMFIMFSVFVILRLIENTLGIGHTPGT
jgi:uncharacterized membrane protein YcgQ (UPF0703/DUF1980 family)